jgi:hypothetical protein
MRTRNWRSHVLQRHGFRFGLALMVALDVVLLMFGLGRAPDGSLWMRPDDIFAWIASCTPEEVRAQIWLHVADYVLIVTYGTYFFLLARAWCASKRVAYLAVLVAAMDVIETTSLLISLLVEPRRYDFPAGLASAAISMKWAFGCWLGVLLLRYRFFAHTKDTSRSIRER